MAPRRFLPLTGIGIVECFISWYYNRVAFFAYPFGFPAHLVNTKYREYYWIWDRSSSVSKNHFYKGFLLLEKS